MATHPELIFCADGNRRFAKIAIEVGFTFGAQLPNTVYFPPEFCDQNWRKPNLSAYLAALGQYRPRLATVLDWERSDQFNEVMAWVEAVACLVSETVIVIPKVPGEVHRIPRQVGRISVRLGYSVPTKFSGTPVSIREFQGRPVHLLGGSPHAQIRLAREMDVISTDGNYAHKMATRYNQYFVHDGSANFTRNRFWPSLKEATNGKLWGDGTSNADAPYEAFRRSCENIMRMWQGKPPKRYYPVSISLWELLNESYR